MDEWQRGVCGLVSSDVTSRFPRKLLDSELVDTLDWPWADWLASSSDWRIVLIVDELMNGLTLLIKGPFGVDVAMLDLRPPGGA